MSNFVNISGKTFGSWTVLERAGSDKWGKALWKCKCSCGRESLVASQNIRKGGSRGCVSCGQSKLEKSESAGKRYGMWVLVKKAASSNGQRWLCRCDCGVEKILPMKSLIHGDSQRCYFCSRKLLHTLCGKIPLWMFTQISRSAKARNHEFTIDIGYIASLFEKQSGKCAATGVQLLISPALNKTSGTTASLDRIDNSKGYVVGNVRWVHKIINIMRGSLTIDEFVYWCKMARTRWSSRVSNTRSNERRRKGCSILSRVACVAGSAAKTPTN